jgi:hypothetical protein
MIIGSTPAREAAIFAAAVIMVTFGALVASWLW